MKALVGAFNQEKALVGAFSVIVKTVCGTDGALDSPVASPLSLLIAANSDYPELGAAADKLSSS